MISSISAKAQRVVDVVVHDQHPPLARFTATPERARRRDKWLGRAGR